MAFLIRGIPLFVLALTVAFPAWGQEPKGAGVVTALQGQATVSRPIIPRPLPLKYKDDVFVRDRIDTGENSVIRLLLGGKALVTVRELSVLTITEEPNRAVVDLQVGKVAVGVAKKLLRPGESIEVRTPNAIASVRGSYLVAIVTIVGGIPQVRFTALEVSVPITVSTAAGTVSLPANSTLGVSGVGSTATVTTVQSVTSTQRTEANQAGQAPKSEEHTGTSPAAIAVTVDQVTVATQLAAVLAPPPPPSPPPPPPSTSDTCVQCSVITNQALPPPPPPVLSSVTPNTVADQDGPQTLTLAGSGFVSGSQVTLQTGGTVIQPTTTVVSSTEIQVQVDFPVGARWTAQVTNANGASAPVGFTVLPNLASVAPNQVIDQNGVQTLTLAGSGFAPGAQVTLQTGSTVIQPTSTTVSSDGKQIQVQVDFPVGAQWTAQVTNPGNLASGSVGFTVLPNLTGVTPNQTTAGTVQTLTLTGSGFAPGAQVILRTGDQVQVITPTSVTPTQIQIQVSGTLTAGDYTVEVTNPGDVASPLLAFTVLSPPPPPSLATPDVEISNTTRTLASGESLKTFSGTGDRTLSTPVVKITNSQVSGPGNVIQVDGGASWTVAARLLEVSGSNISGLSNVLSVHGSLTNTSTSTSITLDPTTISTLGDFILIGSGGNLSLAGPLLSDVGGTLSAGGDFLSVQSGGTLTSTTLDPLIQLSGSTVTVGTDGTDTHFLQLSGASSLVSLKGGLLKATGGSLTVKGDDVLEITSGATLEVKSSAPLIELVGSSLTTLSGSGCVGCPQALLHLFGTSGGSASTLALTGGPLLKATNSPLVFAGDFLNVSSGGTLTNLTTDPSVIPGPLIQLSGSELTVGNPAEDPHFLRVSGSSSTVTLAAGLLQAINSPLNVQDEFIELSGGASLTSVGSQALVSLVGSPLTTGEEFLNLSKGGVALGGSLLTADASPLTVGSDLVKISGGGTLTSTAANPPPLVILTGPTNGQTHSIDGAIFNLAGSKSTDKPLQYGGVLLQTSGATVTAQNGLAIDPALLEATAPLFNLLNGSQVTSTSSFVKIEDNSKLTALLPSDALIKLDASTLLVNSGALVRLTGGSMLIVTGDLVRLSGGSTLTLLNGPLLDIRGNSTATISGALIAFSGIGNTVSISNNLCPCTLFGGIPVALNGVDQKNVSITNPIKNLSGNTFSLATPNTAVIVLDGSKSKVTISGN